MSSAPQVVSTAPLPSTLPGVAPAVETKATVEFEALLAQMFAFAAPAEIQGDSSTQQPSKATSTASKPKKAGVQKDEESASVQASEDAPSEETSAQLLLANLITLPQSPQPAVPQVAPSEPLERLSVAVNGDGSESIARDVEGQVTPETKHVMPADSQDTEDDTPNGSSAQGTKPSEEDLGASIGDSQPLSMDQEVENRASEPRKIQPSKLQIPESHTSPRPAKHSIDARATSSHRPTIQHPSTNAQLESRTVEIAADVPPDRSSIAPIIERSPHQNSDAGPALKAEVPITSPFAIAASSPAPFVKQSDISVSSAAPEHAHAPIPQLREAHLVSSSQPELRVALHTSELGAVEVRATLRDSALHAVVRMQDHELREVIGASLANLENRISDQHIPVGKIDLQSGASAAGQQQHQEHQTSRAPLTRPSNVNGTIHLNRKTSVLSSSDRGLDVHA